MRLGKRKGDDCTDFGAQFAALVSFAKDHLVKVAVVLGTIDEAFQAGRDVIVARAFMDEYRRELIALADSAGGSLLVVHEEKDLVRISVRKNRTGRLPAVV